MTDGLKLVVSLRDLTGEPVDFAVRATAADSEVLRRRFNLVGLEGPQAAGTITPLKDGAGLRVDGRIQARVTQNCVVTLEPVVQEIEESFALEFGAAGDVLDEDSGELVVLPDQEQPDPMPEEGLDVGELVAEQLALAIDPYPRKEGADLQAVLKQHGIDADAGKPNPFAALAALKTKG
jgi:uncharacterized metal-binding protein YceD (DUF177 family)